MDSLCRKTCNEDSQELLSIKVVPSKLEARLGIRRRRNDFRCSHIYGQGCQATKQVQKIEDDPPLYCTIYIENHTCYQSPRKELEEWFILLTSLVIEGMSAFFEQLSYPLLGMMMAIMGFIVCLAEMVYRARIEHVTVLWRGKLPLLYSSYPKHKPFGSGVQYFGLAATMWQCFHACIGYYYACKNAENPIKMTVTMFLFCLCLVVAKILNKIGEYSIE